MTNLLFFGNQNSGVRNIIKQICHSDHSVNICDFSDSFNVKMWKNGAMVKSDNSVNFLPYSIVVVMNINDNINDSINYWINKLCNYNKNIYFIYNILSSCIIDYQNIIDILGNTGCIINSYDKSNFENEIRYFLSLVPQDNSVI
jgi:hypothetical protein